MAVKKKNADDEVITISKTIINTVVNEKKAFLNSDLMNDERFKSGNSMNYFNELESLNTMTSKFLKGAHTTMLWDTVQVS